MARRRKAVACPLCGKENWEDNGVCNACWSLWKAGKNLADRFGSDGDMAAVQLAGDLFSPSYTLGRKRKERDAVYGWGQWRNSLGKAILALAGVKMTERYESIAPSTATIDVAREAKGSTSYGTSQIMLPARNVEALGDLYQIVVDALAAAYDEGYSSGSSLLVRLADGDLTVAQLDDKAARLL